MAKSAEETLARVYNIARGVVSPKYLSSDKELTASKKKKTAFLKKKLVGKKSGGRVAKKKKK